MRVEIEEGGDQPEGAATSEEPSTTSASVSKEDDKSAAQIWKEWEEQWSGRREVKTPRTRPRRRNLLGDS